MAKSNDSDTLNILNEVLQILNEEHVFDTSGNNQVIEFIHPKQLQEIIDITITENGASTEEIKKLIRQIARYSVKTSNPHFHNQLYGGVDNYGLAGAWMTESLNTSQYTYEVAPVFMLIEREVLDKALSLANYPLYPDGDGVLCPGGSIANMYGMVVGRYKKFPDVKTKGLSSLPPLAVFTSDCSHYSINKGAHWLGLGTESVFIVKTDEFGRMIPQDLIRAIDESKTKGYVPYFVNATAGTTILASIDPLDEIAIICKNNNLWFHVDACLGGTLLLSDKYSKKLKGIEKSNSIAWNPHKMLGAPFQCSLFLVKGKNLLHEANCAGATYLFQQDKFYDVSWDTGDKSLQCGRKVDALKLWLMWRARGTKVLGKLVDTALESAEYFFEKIKIREGFRLAFTQFDGNTICFWYIPPSLRGQDENDAWWNKLYDSTSKIKELLVLDGRLMIGYTPMKHKNFGNFFRMVVCCQPPPSHSTMDFAIEQIEKIGSKL